MNHKLFFDKLRLSGLNLTEQNVFGMEKHLAYAKEHDISILKLPYILATSWWETGQTMTPVLEAHWVNNAEAWRKRNLRYYPYYGRGLIQVTWKDNYIKVASMLGLSKTFFILSPEKLLEWKYALPALFLGMEQGIYTGKNIDYYIDEEDEGDEEDLREFIAARRVVNGTDKAAAIGKLSINFEYALKAVGYGEKDRPPVLDHVPATPKSKISIGKWAKAILKMFLWFLKGAR